MKVRHQVVRDPVKLSEARVGPLACRECELEARLEASGRGQDRRRRERSVHDAVQHRDASPAADHKRQWHTQKEGDEGRSRLDRVARDPAGQVRR